MTEYRISATDGLDARAHFVDDDQAREWARRHVTDHRRRVMLDRRAADGEACYPWESLGPVTRLRLV